MAAFSRLKRVLEQRCWSVAELHRRIRGTGQQINLKSRYRLTDAEQAVERLDLRVAGAICQVCEVPLSDWIVFEGQQEPEYLHTLRREQQARLDVLMAQHNNGALTPPEHRELEQLVRETGELTLANARSVANQLQQSGHINCAVCPQVIELTVAGTAQFR